MKEGDVVSLNFILKKKIEEGCCKGCVFENLNTRCPDSIQINCANNLILTYYNDARKKIPDFQPFDKVLYRNSKNERWAVSFISYIDSEGDYCLIDGSTPEYIIPYNDSTNHLWDNITEAPKKYIWW